MVEYKLAAFADEASDVLPGQIDAMKANGVDYLEVRAIDKKNVTKFSDDEVKQYRAQLDDADIKVWSIGSPIGKVQIDEDFGVELDRFKRTLEIAEGFDAKCIRLFSFYGTEGDEKYLDRVLENMNKFVEAAKGSGVVLCHENEKGIYGDVAARCLQIHKALPDIKCVFDPANFVQSGQDVMEAWDMLEPYVYYGHIKDSLEDGNVVPPGKGMGHLREYLPKFFAKGCRILTLEPHLVKFTSLKDLEKPGEESKIGSYYFETKRDAFDFAAKTLKEILEEI